MKTITPISPGTLPVVSICFASDDNYAPYLRVALYSLLQNCNRDYGYDILILHKNISQENQRSILQLAESKEYVSIRFLDMSMYDEQVVTDVGQYYSVETNYRLFLFSGIFAEYDRMLYLDCDIVVTGDVCELYDIDLEGKLVGAVEGVSMRYLAYVKRPLFVDNVPYNAANYISNVLGIQNVEEYFNAGVLLLDLQKCREQIAFPEVLEVLHRMKYCFNDQDVLNILLKDKVYLLDGKWNYMNNIEWHLSAQDEAVKQMFVAYKREDFKIIHYISGKKPWNATVPLGNYYKQYEKAVKILVN